MKILNVAQLLAVFLVLSGCANSSLEEFMKAPQGKDSFVISEQEFDDYFGKLPRLDSVEWTGPTMGVTPIDDNKYRIDLLCRSLDPCKRCTLVGTPVSLGGKITGFRCFCVEDPNLPGCGPDNPTQGSEECKFIFDRDKGFSCSNECCDGRCKMVVALNPASDPGQPKYYLTCRCQTLANRCPDLVVSQIYRPEWDNANRRSILKADIKNIGTALAPETLARVIDPSTTQGTGAPYNDVATTPALNPGATTTVTFYLPYWVYNPDALLEFTADYKQTLQECLEDNNTETFSEQG